MTEHQLILDFSTGGPEIEVPPDHPLVGPYRKAIDEGGPPGAIRLLLVDDLTGHAAIMIGWFVLSPGDQMLFFPGAEGIEGTADNAGKVLDHLTVGGLDRDRLNVHATWMDGSHGPAWNLKVERGLTFCFTVTMPDLSGLYRLPGRVIVRFPRATADAARFGRAIIIQADATPIGPVQLPPPSGDPNFLQMDVWLGTKPGWEQTERPRLRPWVFKPYVAKTTGQEQTVNVTGGPIAFREDRGLIVNVARPSGALHRSGFLVDLTRSG